MHVIGIVFLIIMFYCGVALSVRWRLSELVTVSHCLVEIE